MTGKDITVQGPDAASGLSREPGGRHGPGVIVIQEIFGSTMSCGRFAMRMRRAVALRLAPTCSGGWSPASAHRQDPGGMGQAFGNAAFRCRQGRRRYPGVHRSFAQVSGVSGKVGAWAIALADGWLTSPPRGPTADAFPFRVLLKRSTSRPLWTKPRTSRSRLMLHIAAKDAYTPPEAQAQIAAGLEGNSLGRSMSIPKWIMLCPRRRPALRQGLRRSSHTRTGHFLASISGELVKGVRIHKTRVRSPSI